MKSGDSALITGARAPIALELCRALARSGVRVVLADSLRFPLARFSRFASYVRLPAPAREPAAFREALLRLIDAEGITDVLPTCEETFHLARIRDALPARLWTHDLSSLDRLHHKHECLRWIEAWIDVPKTVPLTEWLRRGYGFEAPNRVFKRAYTRFATEVVIGTPNAGERQRIQSEPGAWLVQERLRGDEVCVTSIWNHGALRGYATYRPAVRHGGGAGVVFEAVEHPDLQARVESFGRAIGMHGLLSFDVMIEAGGRPVVIECNPRGTSGLHLFGGRLGSCFLEDEPPVILDANAPVRGVKLAAILADLSSYKVKDVIWDTRDPMPAVLQMLGVAELASCALRNRCSLTRATTLDFEWNGFEKKLAEEGTAAHPSA